MESSLNLNVFIYLAVISVLIVYILSLHIENQTCKFEYQQKINIQNTETLPLPYCDPVINEKHLRRSQCPNTNEWMKKFAETWSSMWPKKAD